MMSSKWKDQTHNDDCVVKVTDAYCRDGSIQTDFMVCDRSSSSGDHAHYAFDEYGEQVYARNPYSGEYT